MTIKSLYPNAKAQVVFNVLSGPIDTPLNVSVQQSQTTTYANQNGVITYAPPNTARYNYNAGTGELEGLYLGGAVTQILKVSNGAGAFNQTAQVQVDTSDTKSPDGTFNAMKITGQVSTPVFTALDTTTANTMSFFLKKGSSRYVYMTGGSTGYNTGDMGPVNSYPHVFDLQEDKWTQNAETEPSKQWYYIKYPNGWYYFYCTFNMGAQGYTSSVFVISPLLDSSNGIYANDGSNIDASGNCYVAFLQAADTGKNVPVSLKPITRYPYMPSTGSVVALDADVVALSSAPRDYDAGVSLLLDLDSTTDGYIYQIYKDDDEKASLLNDGGTLKWEIDGVSAQSKGEYPQVGFLKGRVRTCTTFGQPINQPVDNYLYTTGISFPTVAQVAPGMNNVRLTGPQTVKAAYLWSPPISSTEAVSVIQGKYNVIPIEPIDVDSYSFVYNTDPANKGEDTISLPYISPTVAMTVDWGDGTVGQPFEQGVVPSHTYPYPGQYRIQITADDGFDSVRLANIDNTIERVDQWAPQHRVGATGTGFTASGLESMLFNQSRMTAPIPPFKYSGLTSLKNAFSSIKDIDVNGWDWVPYNIPEIKKLGGAFQSCGYTASSDAEKASFPQLITGPDLEDVNACFYYDLLTGFVDRENGNSPTNKPFTNSSNITNWNYCFYQNKLTDVDIDTSSATSLSNTFYGNSFVNFPAITTNNVVNFGNAWQDCEFMETFPDLDYSSANSLSKAWSGCKGLNEFPVPGTNAANLTNIYQAFSTIPKPTSFPSSWDFSKAQTIAIAWAACTGLTSFPAFSMPEVTAANNAWDGCTGLLTFPAIDMPKNTSMNYAWRNCRSLATNTPMDCSNASAFYGAWFGNYALTAVDPGWEFKKGREFGAAWNSCASLTDFPPNMFRYEQDNWSATAFNQTWISCALTAQSIENILVSLDGNSSLPAVLIGINSGTNAGKSTWSAAAVTAFDSLVAKGCTILFNA